MNIFEKYPKSKFLKTLPEDSGIFCLRERIIDLFCCFDGLEDSHFESQLDQDPLARLWEMMVAKILKSEKYKPTSTEHGPDFVMEKDGKKIFVEAICPGPGEEGNPNSVSPIKYGASVAERVPVDQIVLRICSALDEKKKKYKEYLKCGIISRSDICVIAISSSKLSPRACLSPPAIMRATHGLGAPYVIFGPGTSDANEGIRYCESIPKASGEEIDTRFFLSGENSLISAVLYSDCSFFSLAFDLLAGSMIIHNPKARNPLPLGYLKHINEIWTICCHDNSKWQAYPLHS